MKEESFGNFIKRSLGIKDESPEVDAEKFLRDKGIIKGDCKHFIIEFSDDRKVNVGEMLTEYTEIKSVEADKRIEYLEEAVKANERMVDDLINTRDELRKENERLRGLVVTASQPCNNPECPNCKGKGFFVIHPSATAGGTNTSWYKCYGDTFIFNRSEPYNFNL